MTMHSYHTFAKVSRDAFLSFISALIFAAAATAEPPSSGRPSSHETEWQWSVNNKTHMTLRLKHEGQELTGVLIANDGSETAIEDGKYDDGVVSFKVSKSLGKNTITTEYAGVIAGMKLNGGMRVYFGPRPKTLPGYAPWQASRARSGNKANAPQPEGNK
jgi:hypothetical protein